VRHPLTNAPRSISRNLPAISPQSPRNLPAISPCSPPLSFAPSLTAALVRPRARSSGFDGLDGGAWNLKNLARAKGSLLDETVDVPGVSSPWLYVGGLFGAFCWHTEDLWMFSCSHLHAGATKTWYVVPAVAASKFEKATRALLPSVFQDAPDLLYQLVAMVAPADLEAQGVPVYTLQQRAGEFIVTFPRAYHAGFSHGFNVAEAVNFASADWLPFGRNAMQCYVRHRRTPVFSVERLLWRLALATTPPISLSTADWVLPELTAVVEEELRSRETLPTGCRHLLLLGHSPVDTAVLAHLAAACNIDQRRQEKVTARIAKEAWREHGKDPRKQPLHRLHWAPPPKEHCDEFCSLGRATNGFQTFEEDALTCLECGRDLFLSGVTALEPPPKSSAGAGGAAAAAAARSTIGVPLSACLQHADSLLRLYESARTAAEPPPSDAHGGSAGAAALSADMAVNSHLSMDMAVLHAAQVLQLHSGTSETKAEAAEGAAARAGRSFASERHCGRVVAWQRHEKHLLEMMVQRLSARLNDIL